MDHSIGVRVKNMGTIAMNQDAVGVNLIVSVSTDMWPPIDDMNTRSSIG
jgi:hypothetical protein